MAAGSRTRGDSGSEGSTGSFSGAEQTSDSMSEVEGDAQGWRRAGGVTWLPDINVDSGAGVGCDWAGGGLTWNVQGAVGETARAAFQQPSTALRTGATRNGGNGSGSSSGGGRTVRVCARLWCCSIFARTAYFPAPDVCRSFPLTVALFRACMGQRLSQPRRHRRAGSVPLLGTRRRSVVRLSGAGAPLPLRRFASLSTPRWQLPEGTPGLGQANAEGTQSLPVLRRPAPTLRFVGTKGARPVVGTRPGAGTFPRTSTTFLRSASRSSP